MTVSFGFHPLALVLSLLVAAGLTYWMYRRTVPPVSGLRKGVLMALRFGSLFLILLLLAEPIVRLVQDEERLPILAVLVDSSESMDLRDEEADLDVGAAMRETLRQLPLNEIDGEVRVYTFGRSANRIDANVLRQPDSLAFDQSRTDIAQALDQIRDDLDNENLQGVVLVSDGQYNTGRNPVYLAEQYPVPIYSVVVGDTALRKDVQVRRVTTNDIAYVGLELPIQVGVRSEGFDNERATVAMYRDGERLSSTQVVLPPGISEVSVDLTYTPDAAGLHRLTIAVDRFDGEVTYANNVENVSVQVLESKQRVLVLAASADPDLGAVRQMLGENPNIEITARTQRSQNSFYEGPFPNDLSDFDAMVLVGYPGEQASQAVAERVARAAEDGIPLFFLLTRRTNLRLLTQVFNDVLPVNPVTVRPRYSEAALDVTPEGRLHPILQISTVPDNGWRRLPPLVYNESLWEASPDARTLATIRVRGVGLDDPLLTIRKRGQTRSAALLGAGTWRWHNVPEDLDAVRSYWPDLLSNILKWITTRDDDRPLRVAPARALFGGGEAVTFNGQAYDESLTPVDDASLEVTVTAPDGREFNYTMNAIGNGRYVLDVGSLPEGAYAYRAVGLRSNQEIGTDNGSFAVGQLTLEFKETRADMGLMRQLARRSQGEALMASEIDQLPTLLAASTFAPVTVRTERERQLWHYYAFLILVLLFLTAEWVLRKRSGMV